MTDRYFTLDASGKPDRAAQLDGISDDLLDGANAALDAVEILHVADFAFGVGGSLGQAQFEQMPDQVVAIYREFSDADLERGAGLQSLIDRYDSVWQALQQDSAPRLDQAQQRLEYWRGDAANAAKSYIADLTEAFQLVESHLTVLEADVVAAREAIASARGDLTDLGTSFKSAAEDYKRSKDAAARNVGTKVLAATFAGAVTGLLAASSMGTGAAAAGTVFTMARGAVFAANVAGSAISAKLDTEISGDSGRDLFESFTDNVDRIRTKMLSTSADLASDIDTHATTLPKIPPPPDVSPGPTFDPDSFETDHTSAATEQNVRQSHVDITLDGRVAGGGGSGIAAVLGG